MCAGRLTPPEVVLVWLPGGPGPVKAPSRYGALAPAGSATRRVAAGAASWPTVCLRRLAPLWACPAMNSLSLPWALKHESALAAPVAPCVPERLGASRSKIWSQADPH